MKGKNMVSLGILVAVGVLVFGFSLLGDTPGEPETREGVGDVQTKTTTIWEAGKWHLVSGDIELETTNLIKVKLQTCNSFLIGSDIKVTSIEAGDRLIFEYASSDVYTLEIHFKDYSTNAVKKVEKFTVEEQGRFVEVFDDAFTIDDAIIYLKCKGTPMELEIIEFRIDRTVEVARFEATPGECVGVPIYEQAVWYEPHGLEQETGGLAKIRVPLLPVRFALERDYSIIYVTSEFEGKDVEVRPGHTICLRYNLENVDRLSIVFKDAQRGIVAEYDAGVGECTIPIREVTAFRSVEIYLWPEVESELVFELLEFKIVE